MDPLLRSVDGKLRYYAPQFQNSFDQGRHHRLCERVYEFNGQLVVEESNNCFEINEKRLDGMVGWFLAERKTVLKQVSQAPSCS